MPAEVQATIAQVRTQIVDCCNWGVAHDAAIHYAEVRPMPITIPRLYLPFTTDCSGFATIMAKWAGASDPNGAGFDGYGNTDTMLEHSPHIARDETSPGDLAVFGLNPSTHVVVLVESAAGGRDALVVSHGQEADPCRVPLSVEAAAHQGEPITFLRLEAGDAPVPAGNPFCPLTVDGAFGPMTTRALQWRLRVATDGVFGPQSKMALQRYLKVPVNGIVGPVTVRALQKHVGAAQDGHWGPLTTEALQRALNAGRF